MKKMIIGLCLMLAGSSFAFGQNLLNDSPLIMANPTSAERFAKDTLPTPEYMTILLLEEGVITPEQVHQAYQLNKDYDAKIKHLTKNPKVSRKELQTAADQQDSDFTAILDDDQQQAYQSVKHRFQQRNWGYNWSHNNQGANYNDNGRRWPE